MHTLHYSDLDQGSTSQKKCYTVIYILHQKFIKSIVSIALWKTITSYERYFFDDTLIRCGEKVNV